MKDKKPLPSFPYFPSEYLMEPADSKPQSPSAKGPGVLINAKEFIVYATANCLSNRDIGLMFLELLKPKSEADFSKLKSTPGIIRVFTGTATRPSITPSIRKRVLSVGKCAFCGSTKNLQVDHIIPYSKGGAHDESNFQCLCQKCNRAVISRKGACMFFHVANLVLCEVHYLNQGGFNFLYRGLIPDYKTTINQLRKQLLNFAVFVGEQGRFNSFWPVRQSAFPVGLGP